MPVMKVRCKLSSESFATLNRLRGHFHKSLRCVPVADTFTAPGIRLKIDCVPQLSHENEHKQIC